MAYKYHLSLTRRAVKDAEKVKQVKALSRKVSTLLDMLEENPFSTPPQYEKLQHESGCLYSRRINKQHRLVYRVDKTNNVVKVLSMWTHYE